MDASELLVGAIVGAAAGYYFGPALNLARSQTRRLTHRPPPGNPKVAEALIEFYRAQGCLYDFPTSDEERITVPFICPPSIDPSVLPTAPFAGTVSVDESLAARPRSRRNVRRRISQGKRIFDEPTLYFDGFRTDAGMLEVRAGVCSYLDCAETMFLFENEAYRNGRQATRRTWTLREKYLRESGALASGGDLPVTIGVGVVVSIEDDDDVEILLHLRSSETSTHGGAIGVIPYFGLWPLITEGRSVLPILYGCMLSEYAEELFGNHELEERLSSRRIDPLWFRGLPYVAELERAIATGSASCSVIGYGADALNGSATVVVELRVSDTDIASRLLNSSQGNWEVRMGTSWDSGLFKVPLWSPLVDQWVRDHRLNFGSAYAIGRLRDIS